LYGIIDLLCVIILKTEIMKREILVLIVALISYSVFSQKPPLQPVEGVRWYTLQEAEKLMNSSPRPLFIDAYTDWCGWCRKMDQDTFSNNVIADILNSKFYPVKFNAEGQESITFLGHTFINDGSAGRAHQLAIELLQGQLSYPTVVFFTKEGEKYGISPVPGYRAPKEMEVLLSFFADKSYKTIKFDDFQKSFVGKVK